MLAKRALLIITAAIVIGIAGCGGDGVENTAANEAENANAASQANDAANDPFNEIESTPTPEEKVEAVTLKPVVAAYCEAMRKKDEAGLRKVYSAATIRSFEADMRAEGVSSLAQYLSTEPVGNRCEVVNERIQGNVGEALVSTETYPNGIMIKFVNEGGNWKMTNQSSDFDAVRKGS